MRDCQFGVSPVNYSDSEEELISNERSGSYSRDAYQYFYCFLYILNNFPDFT